MENNVADEWLTALGAWLWWLLTHRVVLVCIGGAAGTCTRYYISVWVGAPDWAHGFPVATCLINVSGAFVLGAAAAIIRDHLPPEYDYLFVLIGTGFCGGYTTFSTFEYETLQLVRDGSAAMAMAYILGSVVAGFIGVYAAITLFGLVFPKS